MWQSSCAVSGQLLCAAFFFLSDPTSLNQFIKQSHTQLLHFIMTWLTLLKTDNSLGLNCTLKCISLVQKSGQATQTFSHSSVQEFPSVYIYIYISTYVWREPNFQGTYHVNSEWQFRSSHNSPKSILLERKGNFFTIHWWRNNHSHWNLDNIWLVCLHLSPNHMKPCFKH